MYSVDVRAQCPGNVSDASFRKLRLDERENVSSRKTKKKRLFFSEAHKITMLRVDHINETRARTLSSLFSVGPRELRRHRRGRSRGQITVARVALPVDGPVIRDVPVALDAVRRSRRRRRRF